MAATTVDGSKVDEAVKSNVDEAVKSNVDEAVKSNVDELEKSNIDEVEKSKLAKAVAEKTVTLKSSNGELFEITHKAAALSSTIQHMIEDGCADTEVPLPNVNSSILAKVIEYCNKHAAAAAAAGTSSDNTADNTTAGTSSDSTSTASGDQQELKSFDADFIKLDWATLFEIILAANYLDIKGLLDLSCQTVADIIKDKTVEQVREMFNVENDFTPEEEAKVREENQWAFD